MKTIYKFAIQMRQFDIYLPKGAKVLTVQTQHNQPQMWVLLNTDNDPARRTFVTFPTGGEVPDDLILDYIGTFQLEAGYLVFHLFEIAPRSVKLIGKREPTEADIAHGQKLADEAWLAIWPGLETQ